MISETYLQPSRTSTMELFCKNSFIIDIRLGLNTLLPLEMICFTYWVIPSRNVIFLLNETGFIELNLIWHFITQFIFSSRRFTPLLAFGITLVLVNITSKAATSLPSSASNFGISTARSTSLKQTMNYDSKNLIIHANQVKPL